MYGHTTCERAGGTPRVGRCIGKYITCPRHRTSVAPLACPPGAELSPLCRGPKCLVAWHLDATPGPELVGLPAHAFGAGRPTSSGPGVASRCQATRHFGP